MGLKAISDLMLTLVIMIIFCSLTPSEVCSQEGVDSYVCGKERRDPHCNVQSTEPLMSCELRGRPGSR